MTLVWSAIAGGFLGTLALTTTAIEAIPAVTGIASVPHVPCGTKLLWKVPGVAACSIRTSSARRQGSAGSHARLVFGRSLRAAMMSADISD